MCIDQGIRKIKKTSYFIIFVKTILKILYCLNLQSPVTFSSVLMGMDLTLLLNFVMQITGGDLQFSQWCCPSVKILRFISILPQEKYIKVENKANYKEHILSPSSSNCRTLSIQRTFHTDFLNLEKLSSDFIRIPQFSMLLACKKEVYIEWVSLSFCPYPLYG